METINKWLIALVLLCSIISAYIVKTAFNTIEKTVPTIDGKIIQPFHPYNECIKLLIDQANHENSNFDSEKAKSVCFNLLNNNDPKVTE